MCSVDEHEPVDLAVDVLVVVAGVVRVWPPLCRSVLFAAATAIAAVVVIIYELEVTGTNPRPPGGPSTRCIPCETPSRAVVLELLGGARGRRRVIGGRTFTLAGALELLPGGKLLAELHAEAELAQLGRVDVGGREEREEGRAEGRACYGPGAEEGGV